MIKNNKKIILAAALAALVLPAMASAASYFFSPSTESVKVGDSFSVAIGINTEGDDVVVAKVDVTYDKALVSVNSWDTSGSGFALDNGCQYNGKACEIVSNDTENGTLSITLVRPTTGLRTTSGAIAAVSFRALAPIATSSDAISIKFVSVGDYTDSDIIKNDSNGTDVLTSVAPFSLAIYNAQATSSDSEAPSIPGSLTAAAVSASQVSLSWTASTDNTGVMGYRVYRDNAQIGTTTSSQYSDTGLSAATPYAYKVAAFDAAGNVSGTSENVSMTTHTASVTVVQSSGGGGGSGASPATVSVISTSIVGVAPSSSPHSLQKPGEVKSDYKSKEINFTWKNPIHDDLGGILIVRKESSAPTSTTDGVIVYRGDIAHFRDGSIDPGKRYYYAFYAYDKESNYSEPEIVIVEGGKEALAISGGSYSQFGSYITKKHLKIGSRGNDVNRLQQFLSQEGLYRGAVTGYFGKMTQAAVRQFQEDHVIAKLGQEGYGEIGRETRAAMNAHLAPKNAQATQTQKTIKLTEEQEKIIRTQIALLSTKVLELAEELKKVSGKK